jgi:ribosome-binding protein aMBF1 (putative translation factor)
MCLHVTSPPVVARKVRKVRKPARERRKLLTPFEREVCRQLRQARNDRGLTQMQLAALMECTLQWIGDVEVGKRIKLNTVERFARALGFKPTLTLTPLVKGPKPQP